MKRYAVLTALAATLFSLTLSAQAKQYTINVSLDTAPQHVRNQTFHQFAEKLEKASNGELKFEFYESAAKYSDPQAVTAIAQGALDMGAPAQQHLSKFVPNAGILLLPMFYGVGLEQIHRVVDGDLGQKLNKEIEDKLHVVVLGRPLDMGYGTVFTTDKEITQPSDLSGMKVRVPGGAATLSRYRVFGSTPVQIPWPDVPQALQTGIVSAIWATQASVANAELWDAGLHHGFEDRQAFVQYVPMISTAAWEKLPKQYQDLMRKTWDSLVDPERTAAAKDQQDARATNLDHGIVTVDPKQADLDAMRIKLLEAQPEIVQTLKMSPAFVAEVQKIVLSNP